MSNRLDFALHSRHAGTLLGQGGPAGANGTGLHWLLFGTPPSIGTSLASRHLFETFSLHSLAGPILHTAMQIALSSNHILLVCIPHLKNHLCSPCSPNENQKGRLLFSAPISGVPASKEITSNSAHLKNE